MIRKIMSIKTLSLTRESSEHLVLPFFVFEYDQQSVPGTVYKCTPLEHTERKISTNRIYHDVLEEAGTVLRESHSCGVQCTQ